MREAARADALGIPRRGFRWWTTVRVSADGRTVWVNGQSGAGISIVDARSMTLRATVPVDRASHGMTIFP
jgi:hypothetical protein